MKKLTILIAALALVCFSVPAMAADWNFYGSARMNTTYVSDDGDDINVTSSGAPDDKDTGMNWRLQSNARIGARVKGDKVAGRFEYGTGVNLRLLFGEWNFGAGKLLVGQDYTPGASQFISSSIFTGRNNGTFSSTGQADDRNILGFGALYGGRVAQVKASFGGFQVALLDWTTGQVSNAAGTSTNGDIDTYLPKIQASWGMAFDTWNFEVAGGYQTYTLEDTAQTGAAGTDDVDVDSYFVSGMGAVNFGAFTLKAALNYAQNPGNAGWAATGTGGAVWDGTDGLDDTTLFGGALVGVFRLSDMLAFEGGLGYTQQKYDANVAEDKLKFMQAYVQALWTMAPGVYLMPEIGYIDWGKNTSDQDTGTTFYAGAKWQIDF
jgi:hypothetical protein